MNTMRTCLVLFAFATLGLTACEQTSDAMVVEASCGQCQFDLPGKGCDLAVRIDGEAYYVDGAKIDDHGDAHADDGLCNAIRSARVEGAIVDGRFVATNFELVGPTR
jgi:bacterioferritin-associated ferredoxin